MIFRQITEPRLAQNSYLIGCQESGEAIIIDPQRDIDRYIAIAAENDLRIVAAAETHIHADYLSGLREFAHRFGVTLYVSDEGKPDWRYNWVINSDYDHTLLSDGDEFTIGNIRLQAVHTPGHTPEHIMYMITDTKRNPEHPLGIVTGDFIFVGDVGRPDLLETAAGVPNSMEQSARTLFKSIQSFRQMSPGLIVWPGHGAGSACGKALGAVPVSTVAYELATNQAILSASECESFVRIILDGQPEPPPYFARMKRDNRDGPRIMGNPSKPRLVDDIEMVSQLVADNFVFLDTREWAEYAAGHIPGALHTPLNSRFPTVVGCYVSETDRVCVIGDESTCGEALTNCARIGIDTVTHYLLPDSASQATGQRSIEAIDMPELTKRVDLPDVCVVDVRSLTELKETGKIPGALHAPFTQLLNCHSELPSDAHLHVYCRTGNRSAYASSYLSHLGYRVTFVDGGILMWLDIGGKVESVETESHVFVR